MAPSSHGSREERTVRDPVVGAPLPILTLPDPTLRMRSRPVERFDEGLRALVEDMRASLDSARGLGLAAVQVGVLARVAVVMVPDGGGRLAPLAMVNPTVASASDEVGPFREGCLSIPGQWEDVVRPSSVSVAYRDLDGVERTVEMDGIAARCAQHEIDHMDGRLFVDLLSRLRRDRLLKRYAKEARR